MGTAGPIRPASRAGPRCANPPTRPLEKPTKLTVGDGLFLLAKPPSKRRATHGARCGAFWWFRYTFGHTKNKAGDVVPRESMIGLGAYPDVGLADAKGRRDEARRMLAESPPP